MNIEETYETHHEKYYAWMYERQLIWYKRHMLKLPRPWTDDPILDRFRFTNTYRELDRGTLYCHDIVLPRNDVSSLPLALMRLFTYRIFNKVATYDKVFRATGYCEDTSSGEPDWDNIAETLNRMQSDEPIFTGAHTVSSYYHVAGSASKADKVVEFLKEIYSRIDKIALEIEARRGNAQDTHKYLQTFSGIGDFLAYELISDLAYTDYVDFDEDQWANAGPGALNGLKLLYPNPTGKTPMQLMRELQTQQDRYFASMGMLNLALIAPSVHSVRMTLRNIEGGLCEYYKYNKCVGGHIRQPFKLGEGYVWERDKSPVTPATS